MVKAKFRLGIFFICVLSTASLILIYYQMSAMQNEKEDNKVTENRLRKWNEPFSWVSSLDDSETSSSPIPHRLTCRHTIQGSSAIADDKGYLCPRKSVLQSGCCDTNATESYQYSCTHCHLDMGCCQAYEDCVSCCMSPDKKTFLMSVLNEARILSNILILSVSDQYELCLAKCRTSSKSVHHENTYKNPEYKFCYKRIQDIKNPKG
uniref:SREBP regulating gene protein n=1 Tax=Lepeophtheirus salmonis TaxID=72036 RepID=A0A0K2TP98_LEPSM